MARVVKAANICRITATAALSAALLMPAVSHPDDNAVERTAKRAGKFVEKTAKRSAKFVEKTATRSGKFVEKTAKRTGKAVSGAAEKTDAWVQRQTK